MLAKLIQFTVFVCVLGAIGLHGYFFINHDTIDACEVAVDRLAEDLAENELEKIGAAYVINALGRKKMAQRLRLEVGMVSCYRASVQGVEATSAIARSYFRKQGL